MATIEERQQISYTKQFLQLLNKSGTQVKPHTWKNKNGKLNIDNHKIYMRYLEEKMGYTIIEDWYNITRKDFIENKGGGLLVDSYKGSPSQVVAAVFPDYEWVKWKFNPAPQGCWKDKNNHIKYAEWLGKELGYTKIEDWYKITLSTIHENHGGGILGGYYKDSPSQFVMAMFPDYEWLPWKFWRVPQGYWKDKNNHKKYAKWLGKKLGYTKKKDWYKITQKDFKENHGIGVLGGYYKGSPSQFLKAVFPKYQWVEWKFDQAPSNFWQDIINHKRYAGWLGEKLGYTKKKDWYKITHSTIHENYGGGLLVSYYKDSPSQFLKAVFPKYQWVEWKFDQAPSNFWQDIINHIKYAEWLGKELGYTKIEDWYKITLSTIHENHGGGILGGYYKDSPSQFVMAVFPDFKWLEWKFDQTPSNFWQDIINHKRYAGWLGEKLGYTKKKDWYKITCSTIRENYGSGLLQNYYKGSPSQFVMAVFPDFKWEISKFKKGYSRGQIQWLEFLKVSTPDIRHILNHDDGEFPIPGSREFTGGRGHGYHADGFSEIELMIYEYLGDKCHGNPAIYKSDDWINWVKATAGELYNNELKRRKFCEDSGFGYHSIWESEWHRGIKAIRKLQRKFKNRITPQ